MIWLVLLALLLAVAVGFWLIGQLIGLVLMLALAGIIGAAMGSLLCYKGSFLFSIAAGLIGAVVGTIIANVLGVPKFLTLWHLPVIWTAVGAALVTVAAKIVAPSEQHPRLGSRSRGLLR